MLAALPRVFVPWAWMTGERPGGDSAVARSDHEEPIAEVLSEQTQSGGNPQDGAPSTVNNPDVQASKRKKKSSAGREERKLLERIRAGDVEAYGVLVRKYESRVYAVLLGMVRNTEDARELAQKAFIRAYEKLDRFEGNSSFYTWLYRIAFNMAIDFKRRQARRPEDEYDDTRGMQTALPSAPDEQPEDEVRRARLRQALVSAIDDLPKDQRAVVVLREVEGLSYREIAEILDVPEGTVMSRLFYARKKLQQVLGDVREDWA